MCTYVTFVADNESAFCQLSPNRLRDGWAPKCCITCGWPADHMLTITPGHSLESGYAAKHRRLRIRPQRDAIALQLDYHFTYASI
jgi:hypothetical protein